MSSDSVQIILEVVNNASAPIMAVIGQIEKLQSTAAKLKSLGSNISGFGQAMTRNVTLPIVAEIGLATKAAIDFESQMATVQKAFNLTAGTKAADAMSAQILKMSRIIPYAASELAKISADAGMFGVHADQMEPFVRLVGQMGVAFDMSSERAGTAITKLTNVLGYADKQGRINIAGLTEIGDTINYVADNTAINANDITSVVTSIGGVGRNFGLANKQIVALSASYLNLGLAPSVAATSIGSMLPALQAATRQTPKFQRALGELGLTATGLEQSVKKDVGGALRDFITRLGAAKDKTGIITDTFGRGADSRALAQLATDATQLNKAFALIGNSNAAGSMMREFETRAKTTANQLQLLQNNVTEIGINIGAAILPAINSLAEDLRPVLTGFADFAKANPEIVKTGVAILGVVAVVGPLISMIGGAITAIGTIGSALSFLGTSFTSIGALGAAAMGVFQAIAFSVVGLAAILGAATVGMFQFGAAMSGVNLSTGEVVSALGALISDSIAQLPVRLGMIIGVAE